MEKVKNTYIIHKNEKFSFYKITQFSNENNVSLRAYVNYPNQNNVEIVLYGREMDVLTTESLIKNHGMDCRLLSREEV